jgi:hypothetical protein
MTQIIYKKESYAIIGACFEEPMFSDVSLSRFASIHA